MTGQDTVGAPPAETEQKAQDEALSAQGSADEQTTPEKVETVTDPLRSAPNNPMEPGTNFSE